MTTSPPTTTNANDSFTAGDKRCAARKRTGEKSPGRRTSPGLEEEIVKKEVEERERKSCRESAQRRDGEP
eukprot:2555446-Rhodomonas_salina.1